jgi:hypothetical protein
MRCHWRTHCGDPEDRPPHLRSGVARGGNRPQCQRRGDSQFRIARLAAARGAGLGLHAANLRLREPHGQDPGAGARRCHRRPNSSLCAAASGCDDGDPGSVEWHGVRLGSGTSPPSYTVRSSPPNDRSVQQGRSEAEIRRVDLRLPGLRPYQRAGVSRRAQRTASPVRILTFLPSSRSTGGFTTTRSPALTPSLTSISVPRSRISVILCRRTTPFSTTNT